MYECLHNNTCNVYLSNHTQFPLHSNASSFNLVILKVFLKSKEIGAGDRRVGEVLSTVSPVYQMARCANVQRNINPVPYKTDYLGHKLHIHQNEKLATYGLTHVCASDGYNGKLMSFASMPVKNNSVICEHVYR